MENIVFTQLTQLELKKLFREEIEDYFQNNGSTLKPDVNDETGGIDLAVEVTRLSKSTIYGLVARRQIPHSKPAKHLYFSRKELLSWINDGKRKTESEIKSEANNFNPKFKPA